MAQQALKTKDEKAVVTPNTQMVKKPSTGQGVARTTMKQDIYLPSTKDEAYKFAQSFASSAFCPVQ